MLSKRFGVVLLPLLLFGALTRIDFLAAARLTWPENELCYECHPEAESQFANTSHHPINAILGCSACYGRRATEDAGSTPLSDDSICFECHGAAQSLYLSSAHSSLRCITCHAPHGSPNESLLVESNPSLCVD